MMTLTVAFLQCWTRLPKRKSSKNFRFSCSFLFVVISLLLLCNVSVADLPIHVVINDVKGNWSFHMTKPGEGPGQACGSKSPNSNTDNLSPRIADYRKYLETDYGGIVSHKNIILTDQFIPFSEFRDVSQSPNRKQWHSMAVNDFAEPWKKIGSWSMVYDEGIEVTLNEKDATTRFLAFMKYSLVDSCIPHNGDTEDAVGHTTCYKTDPSKTQLGWYTIQPKHGGKTQSGCFYGEQQKSSSSDAPSSSEISFTDKSANSSNNDKENSSPISVDGRFPSPYVVVYQNFHHSKIPHSYYTSKAFVDAHNSLGTSSWIAAQHSLFQDADPLTLSRYVKHMGYRKFRNNVHPLDENSALSASFLQDVSGSKDALRGTLDTNVSADSTSGLYACGCTSEQGPSKNPSTSSSVNKDVGDLLLSERVTTPIRVVSPIKVGNDNPSFVDVTRDTPLMRKNRAWGIERDGKRSETRENQILMGGSLLEMSEKFSQMSDNTDKSKTLLQEVSLTELQGEESIPKSFSWGDPFTDRNFVSDVTNQGNCGSCYSVASVYSLQKRFDVAASKMAGRPVSLFEKGNGLGAQSPLLCSRFNQGCDGGFPYLIGKHAQEIGIPLENCMSYTGDDKSTCRFNPLPKDSGVQNQNESMAELESMQSSHDCHEDRRFYAKDYGYVGGCYECTRCKGESMMEKEIFHNGPLAVAFDAPKSLFSYLEGTYDNKDSTHARFCDDPKGCNNGLTGWEYTNHAVAIVGWGEDANKQTGDPSKYWIVRNSWGNTWGNHGYFKIAKGKNLGGIESQATWIDPDFSRGQGAIFAKQYASALSTPTTITTTVQDVYQHKPNVAPSA